MKYGIRFVLAMLALLAAPRLWADTPTLTLGITTNCPYGLAA